LTLKENKLIKKLFFDKGIIGELFRFGLVGGTCFLIDTGILNAVLWLVFRGEKEALPIAVATAAGFICGVTANYILSILFVFSSDDQKKNGKGKKAMTVFLTGSVIGLLVTWGIMHVGVVVLEFNENLIKVIATAIVMVWNYVSRKIFIFK